MKELSVEQKAQAYDEALEKAKEFYILCKKCGAKDTIDFLEDSFSELKESEGEKIRKSLLEYLHTLPNHYAHSGVCAPEWIAWLEKQGKQNNNEDQNILQRFSFYSYKDEPNILYLAGLYVNDKYRNKGIGTKILEVADEVAKSLNCHAIRLKTKKDSNAERLYRTHGYNSLVIEGRDEIWLEKQGEQKLVEKYNITGIGSKNAQGKLGEMIKNLKSADNVEPKFHEGEWIICCDYEPVQIINIRTNAYEMSNGDIRPFWMVDNNNNIRPWTIQDAKDGDILAVEPLKDYPSPFVAIYKERGLDYFNSHCFISFDAKFYTGDTGHDMTGIHPATKEQRDALEKAMADSGWEFDFEKKELRKIEQKPTEWSKEDERMIDTIISDLERHGGKESSCYSSEINYLKTLKDRVKPQPKPEWSKEDEGFLNLLLAVFTNEHPNGIFSTGDIPVFKGNLVTSNRIIEWLKSLRPHEQWKPSEEQMKALNDLNLTGSISYVGQGQELINLYNDLKKLRR